MSVSRAESQYGRRRSNTAQSLFRPPPQTTPLKIGDSTVLSTWVHEKESSNVLLNRSYWPGVSEGELLRITYANAEEKRDGFLFLVPNEDSSAKAQLQISLPKTVADAFGIRNNGEVTVTKVDKILCSADFVEFTFQDQYLGRNDMWRLGEQLVGQCVHVDQQVPFLGSMVAKVTAIYIGGEKVSSAYVTSTTKTIYRSLTARVTIFIQVCRELWEFAADGERFNEKIVHSFLPALFGRWKDAGANHTVTIVLISRVFYDRTEIDYAEGPLRQDEDSRWYKDFYKVITDLEVIYNWQSTLVSLKDSFWAFQRDILLTHHYHRANLASASSTTAHINYKEPQEARLVGRLSFAHDGPFLEALNMGLNPTETHYIDRSLSLTGSSTIVITPGTGFYRVSKQLLRLTTTRILDQGFGVDLVSLAKPPLHRTPVFSFHGVDPELYRSEKVSRYGARALDPLWGGDDGPADCVGKEKRTFWWEPFWITMNFWDKQMDLPLRQDRFVPRAKMHEIQMLGLLDLDVLSSIDLPYLPEQFDSSLSPVQEDSENADPAYAKIEADRFDSEIFAVRREVREHRSSIASRGSSGGTASSSSTYVASSIRSTSEKRPAAAHRNSNASSRIPPIAESPRIGGKEIINDLDEMASDRDSKRLSVNFSSSSGLSTSPAQSSIRSARSTRSNRSVSSAASAGVTPERRSSSRGSTPSRPSLMSKFTSSWSFNPFRSGPSEPETSNVSASGVSTPVKQTQTPTRPITLLSPSTATPAPTSISTSTVSTAETSRTPKPVAIKKSSLSTRSRTYDDPDAILTHRGSLGRYSGSPQNTPPRDDSHMHSRRSTALTSVSFPYNAASTSSSYTQSSQHPNPSAPRTSVAYSQAALARRWQHMFPQPMYKQDVKWKSMVTPGCLPLTTEQFPTANELETSYDVFSYDFVVDPDTQSFLVRQPSGPGGGKQSGDEARRACALVVMRGMIALRLAQGFQFVLRASSSTGTSTPIHTATGTGTGSVSGSYSTTASTQGTASIDPEYASASQPHTSHRSKSYISDEDSTPKPGGASEALKSQAEPVYLSMSNEIHRISYNGEQIQVRRYVRRMPHAVPFDYKCLIWPKLGVGYTELNTSFTARGLESYGWNRLDMLVAGYEDQFNESVRYWRTRFIVIPSMDPLPHNTGPAGEKLNDEEMRILGIEKLANIFSGLRWHPPSQQNQSKTLPPLRFLPTDLGPSSSVLDEHLMAQLDDIHAAGPLRKKMKSERDIADMTLAQIAKAMREEGGVPIKEHRWHRQRYAESFIGSEFVSWMVREFRDVSSREQGTEWGIKLQDRGLFEHCTGRHSFLDGHYFYQLKGEYAAVSTPRRLWFRDRASLIPEMTEVHPRTGHYPSSLPKVAAKKQKKQLILSQRVVIDLDPHKKSDQAECVVLHHDIIHNPATVFHFELHWIGTTARMIEDALRIWTRTIERYGLKLVEAYVTQISDIATTNPFQSCFPVRLAVPPPIVLDLASRVPEGTHVDRYFEYALLRKFDFVLDIEASGLYPPHIDAIYSYRRSPFSYSQFVHRSGVAFVQVLGGAQGFLFLTNRLMGPGRFAGSAANHPMNEKQFNKERPALAAEELRKRLHQFCKDRDGLNRFWDDELAALGPPGSNGSGAVSAGAGQQAVSEEPPPLAI